jgi:SAM-dependent methyltransferase
MILAADWFREWFNSPYYYDLYSDRDEKEAELLVDHLLNMMKPVPGSLLFDVGCGRGRHARILAERGFDVTGIDIAPDSIEYAKQFENEHLHFFLHDMRLPCWINYFDAAFSFFTSFGYFKNEREHANALRTIAQSLKTGGLFLMDYINTPYVEANLIPESQKNTKDVVYHLTRWSDDHYFYKKILVEDKSIDTVSTFTERIEKYSLQTLTSMLAKQGLRAEHVFGDYALNEYHENTSPRMLILAKKTS